MKTSVLLIFLASLSLYGQQPSFDPERSSGKRCQYAELSRAGNRELSLEALLLNNSLHFSRFSSANQYDEDSFWLHYYNKQLYLGLFYGIPLLAGITFLFFYSSLFGEGLPLLWYLWVINRPVSGSA